MGCRTTLCQRLSPGPAVLGESIGGLDDPELSSTAHYAQPGLHRYEDHYDLVFE